MGEAAAEQAALSRAGDALDLAISSATEAILALQRADGHWVFELEADATIPAEYVLLVHYLAETPNLELERKIGVYLRRIQAAPMAAGRSIMAAFSISARPSKPISRSR